MNRGNFHHDDRDLFETLLNTECGTECAEVAYAALDRLAVTREKLEGVIDDYRGDTGMDPRSLEDY